MRKRLLLTTALISAMLLLLARSCDKKQIGEINNVHLKRGEKEAVVINGNSVSVVRSEDAGNDRKRVRSSFLRGRKPEPEGIHKQTVERVDGARGVRISVGDDGAISVQARTHGLCFEPGLGGFTTSGNSGVFIDAQLGFIGRNGLNAGFGLGLRGKLEPSAFVAYSYNFYSNTSLLVGLDNKKNLLLGLRVKF